MRPAALILILALSACGGSGPTFQKDTIISDVGGEKIILANGVCIRINEQNEEDEAHIVPRSRCGV
ncbi:MAG: hypothetical protein ACFB03_20065 [Paracoccaceae bacterium]